MLGSIRKLVDRLVRRLCLYLSLIKAEVKKRKELGKNEKEKKLIVDIDEGAKHRSRVGCGLLGYVQLDNRKTFRQHPGKKEQIKGLTD